MSHASCDSYRDDLMALLEGAIEGDAAASLREHLASCAICRAEYKAFDVMGRDLEAMGDRIVENLPTVDLVAPVLSAVSRAAAQIAQPKPRASRRIIPFWPVLSTRLAAAILLIALGAALLYVATGPDRDGGPTPGNVVVAPKPGPDLPVTDSPLRQKIAPALSEAKERLAKATRRPSPDDGRFATTSKPTLDSISLEDVFSAWRDAAVSDEDRYLLDFWSRLTPEEARKVAALRNSYPGADVAAARFLGSSDETAQALLEAVGHMPDDPAARFELAKAYGKYAGAEAMDNLDALQYLDPENGLLYGLEALALLNQGRIEEALALLNQMNQLDRADTYSLQSAQYYEQALQAQGMDPEVARALAAFNAGGDDAQFLRQIGRGLLDQGQNYEETEPQSAQHIYEAVNRLGRQLVIGAAYSQVQLAGLDLQLDAIAMLEDLVSTPEQGEELVADANELGSTIGQAVDFINNLGSLFSGDFDAQWFSNVLDVIMGQGDLALADLVSGNGQ